MKFPINNLDAISPCVTAHYHKDGYSDILIGGGGKKDAMQMWQ